MPLEWAPVDHSKTHLLSEFLGKIDISEKDMDIQEIKGSTVTVEDKDEVTAFPIEKLEKSSIVRLPGY